MADVKLNYDTSMFRLCMDTKNSGTVISRRLTKPFAFNDLPCLLLRLDHIMDAQDYPRAFQRKRRFDEAGASSFDVPFAREESEMLTESEVSAARGELATFMLHVVTRQNSSWQGALILEDMRRVQFESALELLGLLGSFIEE